MVLDRHASGRSGRKSKTLKFQTVDLEANCMHPVGLGVEGLFCLLRVSGLGLRVRRALAVRI